MKNKKIFFEIVFNFFLFTPVLVIYLFFFEKPILDVDALAYHLFSVRLIEENLLFYFDRLNTKIGSGLGYEMSIFYPNLYSYIIVLFKKISFLNTYKSSYALSCLFYLILLYFFKNKLTKLILLIYFLMPANFVSLFISGNNYFLSSFLMFVLFILFYEKKSILLIFLTSFLLINTHVLMPYTILVFFTFEIFFEKNKNRIFYLIISIILIFILHLSMNVFITGSLTFPFLQNIFPNKDFNLNTWAIILEHLNRSIYYQDFFSSKKHFIIYIMFPISFLSLILMNKDVNKKHKIIFFFIILPSFFFFITGFRHRIIFLTGSFLIFLYLIKSKDILNFLNVIFQKLKANFNIQFLVSLPIILFLLQVLLLFYYIRHSNFDATYDFTIKKSIYEKSTNNIKLLNSFYKKIDKLSKNHKILYTEIAVENIENYKNLLSPLYFTDEINSFKSSEEFYSFLKNKNIKFITHTPLSSNNYYNLKFPHVKFLDLMIENGELNIFKNFNDINYDKIDIISNLEANWIIYEVQ